MIGENRADDVDRTDGAGRADDEDRTNGTDRVNGAVRADRERDLKLAYYGDDFTGSTDVLESLALHGIETVLFLEPPEPSALEAFEDVEAVGVAGRSRTMSPAEMDEHLPQVFEALDALGADLFHYKVCSTFDSSPEVGSIGHAIDLGWEAFGSEWVPLVAGAPPLAPRGRYVVFGNLFATVDGETHRLDRHPTMRDHPVTPMTEADLRRHLAAQTDRTIGLVDVLDLADDPDSALSREFVDHDIVCFDTLDEADLAAVGRVVWERASEEAGTTFAVGSSGLDYALAAHWESAGAIEAAEPPKPPEPVDRIAVMSGSASPATAAQIDWALENGFAGVRLDTEALIDPDRGEEAMERAVASGLDALLGGESVVLYAARGTDDPAIAKTRTRGEDLGLTSTELGRRLGERQGAILRELVTGAELRRACVAGGDTSGYVAPALSVYALEFAAVVGPGSPLCRARSHDGRFDGIEIALKGGQVQTTNEEADYFELVRQGGAQRMD